MISPDLSSLPAPLRPLVETVLEPGESPVWTERPLPGHMARASLPAFVLGVVWTAFAVFWTVGSFQNSPPPGDAGAGAAFPWFGLPFILIGLLILTSPWRAWRNAGRSLYLITDRRAVVILAAWRGGLTVRSFDRSQLNDLRRRQRRDGSGDLIFARDIRRDSDNDKHTTDAGFLGIRDVRATELRIKAMIRAGGK